jgi:hypothetical protein
MTLRRKQDTATLKRTGGEELDKKGGKKNTLSGRNHDFRRR